MRVDAALGQACRLGDVVEARGREALVGEHLQRYVEDLHDARGCRQAPAWRTWLANAR